MQEWRKVKGSARFAGAPSRWSDRRKERECSAKGEVRSIFWAQNWTHPRVTMNRQREIPNLNRLVITERRKILYLKGRLKSKNNKAFKSRQ